MTRLQRRSRVLAFALSVVTVVACSSFFPEVGDLQNEPTSGPQATSGSPDSNGSSGAGSSGTSETSETGTAIPPDGAAPPAAAEDGGADAEAPNSYTVLVGPSNDTLFNPKSLTIRLGDEVRWLFMSAGHTVESDTGLFCAPDNTNCASAPNQPKGAVYVRTFSTRGIFAYRCGNHGGDGMRGTIIVQ